MSIEAMKLARQLLLRYRHETPIGHQPYMICQEVDEAIERIDQAIEQAELVQRAEEAFERSEQYDATSDHRLMENAQGDLERIEQAQSQEPVAVARVDDLERGGRVRALAMGLGLDAPLYTSPPPRQPLTDEQIDNIWHNSNPTNFEARSFARAVEAKLKAKNA